MFALFTNYKNVLLTSESLQTAIRIVSKFVNGI